ncbi:MAG: hypothetical protein CMM01_25120 [Rhodopirellula sp.]|nr:hypothetical protein [Rhodopirellula sp.]
MLLTSFQTSLPHPLYRGWGFFVPANTSLHHSSAGMACFKKLMKPLDHRPATRFFTPDVERYPTRMPAHSSRRSLGNHSVQEEVA